MMGLFDNCQHEHTPGLMVCCDCLAEADNKLATLTAQLAEARAEVERLRGRVEKNKRIHMRFSRQITRLLHYKKDAATLTAEVERLKRVEEAARNLIESDDNLRVLNEWGDPTGYYEVDEGVFDALKQALEGGQG